MKKILFPVLVVIIAFLQGSCRKIEQLSPVPHVEFRSFLIFDTMDILGNKVKGGRLKFYFEDGDGDLGLNVPASGLTDTTNLFFKLFRKTNGNFIAAPDNDPLKPSAYRIPFMDRQGQNKILKGTIEVTFLYLFYTPSDTIKYDFFIKDRALHVSDTSSTSEIAVAHNNLYTK